MFVGAGAATAINPGMVLAGEYSLPNSVIPEIWAEIYERNIHNEILNYETFLNQMRGLEAAAGNSMKPLIRDLIVRWEDFLIRGASMGAGHETADSMANRTYRALKKGPRTRCHNVFSGFQK